MVNWATTLLPSVSLLSLSPKVPSLQVLPSANLPADILTPAPWLQTIRHIVGGITPMVNWATTLLPGVSLLSPSRKGPCLQVLPSANLPADITTPAPWLQTIKRIVGGITIMVSSATTRLQTVSLLSPSPKAPFPRVLPLVNLPADITTPAPWLQTIKRIVGGITPMVRMATIPLLAIQCPLP